MAILGWRLWTSTGVYSSRDCSWSEAPDEDIQALVTYDAPGYRTLTHGPDYFWLPGDRAAAKRGRLISDEAFAEILEAVQSAEVL